jgi:ADP-ribose pyrophosphatase YjhB (NUDIX family)
MIEIEDNLMYRNKMHCDNCNSFGHDYKSCKESISSWGIILVRFDDNNMENSINDDRDYNNDYYDSNDGIKYDSLKNINFVSENINKIKFLLIKRKHSLGYTEFIRGNYKKDNINGIIFLFQQMTQDEITNISLNTFDDLWDEYWGSDLRKKSFNKKQYIESKENFNCLKNKIGVDLSLDFYVNKVKSVYLIPEYGIPKGRKQRGESDIDCAVREFCEETGYSKHDFKIVNNVKPIIENMVGTNGISYRFVYYLAEDLTHNQPKICEKNANEIGGLGFYSYQESLYLIREYHIEKRNIIKNVFMFYLNNLIKKNKGESKPDDNNKNKKVLFSTEFDEF